MVVIAIPKKVSDMRKRIRQDINGILIELTQSKGIPMRYLFDSISIDEGIDSIATRVTDIIEEVKPDKHILFAYKEGKKLMKAIKESEK